MIEQNVQVIACRGERIQVRLGSQSGCTACDNGNGCGAGVFAKLLQRKPVVLELQRNEMSVEPGQMVTLSFPEQVYLKLVFVSYGWPLLAALAGAFAGHSLGTWLQFGPGLVDAITLFNALLFAGLILRYVSAHGDKGAVLNSLYQLDYHPSETPGLCSNAVNKSQEI